VILRSNAEPEIKITCVDYHVRYALLHIIFAFSMVHRENAMIFGLGDGTQFLPQAGI
jgi:hypothetical protein